MMRAGAKRTKTLPNPPSVYRKKHARRHRNAQQRTGKDSGLRSSQSDSGRQQKADKAGAEQHKHDKRSFHPQPFYKNGTVQRFLPEKCAAGKFFCNTVLFCLFCFFRKRQLEPERRPFALLTVHAIGDVVRFQNTAHDA